MKIHRFFAPLLAVAICSAAIADQPAPTTTPETWQEFQLHNTKAEFVAWWLDPDNNKEPIEFEMSRKALGKIAAGNAGTGPVPMETQMPSAEALHVPADMLATTPHTPSGETLQLPKGVETTLAVKAKNCLLAYGDADGLQHLQTLLNAIDKPLDRTELIVQFVEIPLDQLKEFGINSDDVTRALKAKVQPGYLHIPLTMNAAHWEKEVDEFMEGHQGKLLTAPRIVVFDKCAADIHVTVASAIDITKTIQPWEAGMTEPVYVYLTSQTGVTLLSKRNDDDTVTAAIWPDLIHFNVSGGFSTTKTGVRPNIVKMKNDMPYLVAAFDGARIPHQLNPTYKKVESEQEKQWENKVVLIFATAHIIYRVPETPPIEIIHQISVQHG